MNTNRPNLPDTAKPSFSLRCALGIHDDHVTSCEVIHPLIYTTQCERCLRSVDHDNRPAVFTPRNGS